MIVLCEHNECTGCGACFNACPTGCIEMRRDVEGFLFPNIDAQRCTQCQLCVQSCPILSNPDIGRSEPQDVYACWNLDENIRMESSSGGMFSVFADYVLENKGVIYGAILDDSQQLNHAAIFSKEELRKVRKSKYFQSDIRETFCEAKRFLDSGRNVFFTGTPCQVAGLYGYLGKNCYENLLTADIVCHGVPSALVFEKYLQHLETKNRSQIESLSFRDKKNGWTEPEIFVSFKNGRQYRKSFVNEDPYSRAFLANICLRESCHCCQYATIKRYGDITLADFWGIGLHEPFTHETDKGVSLVMLNSEIACQIFYKNKDRFFSEKRTLSEAVNGNANLRGPTGMHPDRTVFFANLHKLQFDKLVDKYVPRVRKLRSALKNTLGHKMVMYIRAFRKMLFRNS